MATVHPASDRALLCDLVDRVEAGETVEILRNGRLVARLSPAVSSFKPIDVAALDALTAGMKMDPTESVVEMRRQARY